MTVSHFAHRSLRKAALILLLIGVIGAVPASASGGAARDRTPPTRPTNLRVTAVSPYSVSLAWNPSSDNSSSITYGICCASTSSLTVAHPTTTATFTTGVEPGWTHSFRVFARDAAGNTSGYSNTVTVTIPNDTTAPSAPTLSLSGSGPSYASLSWTASTDDDPILDYLVFVNGSMHQSLKATSTTVTGLSPATSYTFTVQALDNRGHRSAPSNAITLTTAPADPTDTTPPSPPANLTGSNQGEGEADLRWTQSTDNVDPQFSIRYEVFVNGIFRPESTVIGFGRTIAYAVTDGFNTFEVVAVDSAGNRSTAASITICMAAVC